MSLLDATPELEPYRPNNPVDGIDVTAVLDRAQRFAVEAERLHKDRLLPASEAAASIAQAWAAIAVAARTGAPNRTGVV